MLGVVSVFSTRCKNSVKTLAGYLGKGQYRIILLVRLALFVQKSGLFGLLFI